jgi:hypothetical protein
MSSARSDDDIFGRPGRLPLPAWYTDMFESGKHGPLPPVRQMHREMFRRLPEHSSAVHLSVPAAPQADPGRGVRGVFRSNFAPEGWRVYYAVNAAGFVVVRLDLQEGHGVSPRVVKDLLREFLELLDPGGALKLVP